MKKSITLLFILCLGGLLLAVPFSTSVLYNTSNGLFTTPIDQASDAGQGFLDLDKTFIFGGLANLNQTRVISSTSNSSGTNTLGAVSLGAYFNTNRPWSLFTNLYHDSTSWFTGANSISDSYNTKTVGSNTQEWLSQRVETKYYGSLAKEVDDRAQYLTELNGMVIGGSIRIYNKDNSVIGNNFSEKTTYYYDNAAAGVAPDVKADYTREEKQRRKANDFRMELRAPLFMPGEKVDQTFSAMLGFGSDDNGSGKREVTYSTPVKTPSSLTDVLHDDVKDKTGFFQIAGGYRQDMPSPFTKSESKDFYFGGNLNFTFYSPAYSTLNETQRYNYTLSGSTMNKAKSTYSYTSEERKFGLTSTMSISGMVGHRFSYDLGKGMSLKLAPEVGVYFSSYGDEKVKERTTITKSDTNNDGVVDSTTTVTREYENTNSALGDRDTNSLFIVDILPSCAFTYQPETWDVGFTLGTKLDMSMQYSTSKTKESYVKTTTKTESGGVTTTTTSDAYSGTLGLTTHSMEWVTTLTHSLSMNWDINENATLYADLTGTIGSGIFDFGRLTVQAVISLP